MPEMITDAELVADLRTLAGELYMGLDLSQDELLRLADAVEERMRVRSRSEKLPSGSYLHEIIITDTEILPLGSLAEHRRSVEEEAKRLLHEAQAVEARYKHGIGDADWEG